MLLVSAPPGSGEAQSARPLSAPHHQWSHDHRVSVGRELLQFALAGVFALVLLAALGRSGMHRLTVNEAIGQAREMTVTASRFVVAPAVSDELVSGQPAAVQRFDQIVRQRLLLDRVVRVKLWSSGGRIVYSDDARLMGLVYPLGEDDQQVLRTGRPYANLSDLNAPENALERSQHRLLQVYTRVVTPSGQPLLFESYLRLDSAVARSTELVASVVPAFVVALLTLQVLQLPLAWRLVRRIQHGQRERDALQRMSIAAADHERRRIARDLHDGVVQTLVGVTFSLSAAADKLRLREAADCAGQIDAVADATRSGIAELRSLVTDIYPPSLEQLGLCASLADLLFGAEQHGLVTELEAPEEPRASREVIATLYRAAQEAVRNVVAHAEATHLRIVLRCSARSVTVEVTDNGKGLWDAPADPDRPHLGLRLLHDVAAEVGGRLDVQPAAGGGTCFRLELRLR
ncbi:MAG: putative signal transduction histidine kinase [Frankiales bacterium]|nr:putative signal transduction histidine kinase [Frankiales bacterium]